MMNAWLYKTWVVIIYPLFIMSQYSSGIYHTKVLYSTKIGCMHAHRSCYIVLITVSHNSTVLMMH